MQPRYGLSRRAPDEHGAALIEFALILPLFMMLVLGMFTGGIAYNQKISMTNAAREASRYGATLPISGALDTWLRSVAASVIDSASGDLSPSVASRHICVAYVHPAGTAANTPNDQTRRIIVAPGQNAASGTIANGGCTAADGAPVADGYPSTAAGIAQRRVVVFVSRRGDIQLLVRRIGVVLDARSVTRFEAVG